MASTKLKFSYQKLRQSPITELEEDGEIEEQVVSRRSRGWLRLKRSSSSSRRRRWRRRLRRVRIPGLRRLLRRKAKLVRASLGRVLKRLKESRSHFGELFAGNYMFMQVSPSPLGCLDKSFMVAHADALPPSSRYHLHRVA